MSFIIIYDIYIHCFCNGEVDDCSWKLDEVGFCKMCEVPGPFW